MLSNTWNGWLWQGSALSALIWNKEVISFAPCSSNILNIIIWSEMLEHHFKHGEIVAARQVWLLYQLFGLLKMDRSARVSCINLKARWIEFKIFLWNTSSWDEKEGKCIFLLSKYNISWKHAFLSAEPFQMSLLMKASISTCFCCFNTYF